MSHGMIACMVLVFVGGPIAFAGVLSLIVEWRASRGR